MKLFCIVLVIYVLTLTLCGVDGRGGGGTSRGLEEPIRTYLRARRHATDGAAPAGSFANEKPPPPPQFRTRRNVKNMSNNPEDGAPHLRQRRQMPSQLPTPDDIPRPPMLNNF
ncbi:uncharacterized protein LOC117783987 isoform X2 [Drosophila innubila]|uniref:uncharacterized protein LOC117783987 isoform X2 n=1 Tax=Drosophila innubila TaxID=198719 RepID=UPI00148E3092|nr:uncharacterized protein LOC117783987 isoform X2 [Drosophila innubila]